MTDHLFISSPVNVLTGDAARVALEATSDAAYLTEGQGVLSVPLDRWKQAQQYERDTWLTHGLMLTEDRNTEHAAMFDGYKALPSRLGRVIELGCGPFTNLQHILADREAARVFLLDPLIVNYFALHPHCTYKDAMLCGHNVEMFATSIEADLETTPPSPLSTLYDTVVMINVLSHCQSVEKVFEWIRVNLRDDGYLVFHEPFRDIDTARHYDVGHPLSYTQSVIDDFLNTFVQVYRNGDYFIGIKI